MAESCPRIRRASEVVWRPRRPTGQLAQATARDPIDHRPWGLRTFKSASGETCLALGRVVGTRLGVVHVGQFKELPTRKGGVCGPLATQHMVMSSRDYFDSAIPGGRTVLYGIVDRTIVSLAPATRDRRRRRGADRRRRDLHRGPGRHQGLCGTTA